MQFVSVLCGSMEETTLRGGIFQLAFSITFKV